MAKIRIHELGKELGLESKEVLAKALELGLAVKTASSGLEPEDADAVRAALKPAAPAAKKAPAKKAPAKKAAALEAPAAEPVPEAPAEKAPAAKAPAAKTDPVPAAPAATAPTAVGDDLESFIDREGSLDAPAAPEAEPEVPTEPVAADDFELITVASDISVQEMSRAMRRPLGEVVRTLLSMGHMAAAVAPVPAEAIEPLAEKFGFLVDIEYSEEELKEEEPLVKPKRVFDDAEADLVARPPVITVMGHVDHGKTTLLDSIRNANVVGSEAGGITQHIGAYQVDVNGRQLTFIDTPGHEAFTAMRARGAEVTDIVILVVAADDGVMPQTAEAISHTKAAGVPLIVAINKMDSEGANPNNVRAMLTEHEIVTEDLGGETISVELSALTGENIPTLLEMIDLVSQVEGFKGNPSAAASGVVIESHLDKGLGAIATVIVQRGTLSQGDAIVSGAVSGRVRAMTDDKGERLKSAGPSAPVLVTGWGEVPTAGDQFEVAKNDKAARNMAADRLDQLRSENLVVPTARERLAQLLVQLRTQDEAELRIIIKADADGSVEAIRESVGKIVRDGGSVTVVHSAVGGVNENDVSLADATDSVIIAFNVRPDSGARKAAEAKGIEMRTYSIIYELLDEIEQMLVGRLAPEEVERILGTAEVRVIFRVPRLGAIAGSHVTEGSIARNSKARIIRDGIVIYDGRLASLRRFKDDVAEVAAGFECGIGLERFKDVKEGDIIEAYRVDEIAAT
jgi:translation initiation factor IF-2